MKWLSDFLFARGATAIVTEAPLVKAKGDDLSSFMGRFRARTLNATDPNAVSGDAYLYHHPGTSGITMEQLRTIGKMRPISLFMTLGSSQLAMHGRRRRSRNDIGYELGQRESKKSMSKVAQRRADEIATALERGVSMRRKLFMLGGDMYPLDQGVGQITFGKGGKPWGWMPFDATTFRIAQPTSEDLASGNLSAARPFIQYENGVPKEVFDPEEILWVIRNPRTDQSVLGYGFPEIERAAQTMAAIIKANRFNENFFENGTHARYLLKFRMSMSDEEWESFKRQFQEEVKGLDNAHKILALLMAPGMPGQGSGEDVEKESLSESPKDMEFRWAYGFYYRELAAEMGVDLDEVGMGDPADTGRPALQEAGRGQQILMARERRMSLALGALEDEFNAKFVQPYDPDFEIRFHGMEILTPKEQAELDKLELESTHTWNEVRQRANLPKRKAQWADECPLHPVAAQLWTAEQQRKAQEEAQAKAQAQGVSNTGDEGDDADRDDDGDGDFSLDGLFDEGAEARA
ncbi:MAG TPA: phage portal protein [Myxococcota bacterium]|nr:phage portal protein [Myxococcota bacterium]